MHAGRMCAWLSLRCEPLLGRARLAKTGSWTGHDRTMGSRPRATAATCSPKHPHPRAVATAHAGRPPPSPTPPPRGETPRRHTRTRAPLERARAPRTSRTPPPLPAEPAALVPPRAGLPRAPPRLVWRSRDAAAERMHTLTPSRSTVYARRPIRPLADTTSTKWCGWGAPHKRPTQPAAFFDVPRDDE